MKSLALTFAVILYSTIVRAQISNPPENSKLSIGNFSLCKTTVTSLKQSFSDLKVVEVEEMDLAKNCYGQDARFVAGKGYASDEQPGIIFQQEQQSEYISKIRLTKQFNGKLPDGNPIQLNKLQLKDVFKLYPKLKNKWGSRDCSNYWNFSNDTISFYVKIDKNKTPQFPVDEEYYLDKPVEAIDLVTSCYGLQRSDNHVAIQEETSADPLFFIDSVKISKQTLQTYDPNDIAMVTVYKDSSAINRMGIEAKYGLIYIETKKFAKMRYWRYFKSKSDSYAKLVTSPDNDSNVQYILNTKVLKKGFEGDLAAIDDTVFKEIKIIDKQQLIKEYKITDKEIGVIIKSATPNDLHNGKQKFGN
jgi:hypothetical protein